MLTTRTGEPAADTATRLDGDIGQAGRPPAASRPAWMATVNDGYPAGTVALTFLTLISTIGLVRVFSDHDWLGPVLVTAVGLHATGWAARRLRLPRPVALALALVALWILTAWTVLGSSTYVGFPGAGTASHLWSALVAAHADFATAVNPTPSTTGYTLIAVLGVGAVAIMGDWAAFRWRSSLYGAVPAFAFFVVCSILGVGPGRDVAVTLEVAALLIFLLVHRATVGPADEAWFGNRRAGATRWAITAGSAAAAAALITAALVTPAVAGAEGHGVLGWKGGGLGDTGSGPRQVPNPIVDLHTRLLYESQTPVFKVQSPVSSYWRLTSLDTFTGQDWISTNSYRSFGSQLPGIQAVPPGTRVVQEHFQVQGLGSVWLPDAFTPVAVSGVRHVSYDPVSGSLITSHSTSNGLRYSVESYQYLSDLSPAKLRTAPPVVATGAIRRYLQLPTSVPPDVDALARSITAGQATEYGKALALQNFFLGPSFTYSLTPPNDGYGIAALTNFLFVSRTGYCQQFAGAYAVLARAVGLPTRLAVGFATGTPEGNGTYQVLNADAHTWPEVYFGPQYGWLPFEPTKGSVDPISAGYAPPSDPGAATGAANLGSPLAPAGGLQTGPLLPISRGKSSATTAGAGQQSSSASAARQHSGVGKALLIILLALVIWMALVAVYRRTRWSIRRWRARGDPGAVVRSHWADVTELLTWWGARPETGETDEEFAERAAQILTDRLREPAPWLPGGVRRLARMVTEATFAPTVSAARAGEAAVVAREIRRSLFRAAGVRRVAVWAVVPRPGRRGLSTPDAPLGAEADAPVGLLESPWAARPASPRVS